MTEPRLPEQPGSPEDVPGGYTDLLREVKAEVTRSRARRSRAARIVNTELVALYWRIGRTIDERQRREGWGAKVVARLATDLRAAFPGQRGFSLRSLMYMLQMARTWPDAIVQQPVAQLPWGHVTVLLSRLSDRSEQDFYARLAAQHGWSRSVLEHHIGTRLHLRNGTLPAADRDGLRELLRDPTSSTSPVSPPPPPSASWRTPSSGT